MIAIIDYNAGNLFSVKNALDYLDIDNEVTGEAARLDRADALILPGVGAFPDAMRQLDKAGLVGEIRRQAKKKPLLGICLGMQLLFEKGYEFEECEGLGLIKGEVRKIDAGGLKIPHMGWNSLRFLNPCPLLDGVGEGSYTYFVHSYMACTGDENIAAYTEYHVRIPALVMNGGVYGAQYHPEKSSRIGLAMLKNFWRLAK
ncbi:MAG: imidazole glycerol phosphate synthase subunit HisH [Clostridia bacterium]|nr:imidazole glycerol phosphate synthase subunit HisH [Clostridia bacterium]